MSYRFKSNNIKNIPLDKIDATTEELLMAICGSVDSSKSTLLAVMSNSLLRTDPEKNLEKCLDDGNGLVRKLITRFPHELETGRTSSVSYTPILFDMVAWPHLKTNRIVMSADLCGHERYLKTTVTGICSGHPNFAIVCVDRVRGKLNPMTFEHIKLLISLKVPFAIIITKIDMQTEESIKYTIKAVLKMLRGKKMFLVKTDKDVPFAQQMCASTESNQWVPFFLISCKTGYGILRLMNFIAQLQPTADLFSKPPLFSIDTIYNVVGHGLIVTGESGINITVGDKLMIGPFIKRKKFSKRLTIAKTFEVGVESDANTEAGIGEFAEITVRSLHDNYKNNIDKLTAGRRGCICVKLLSKDMQLKQYICAGMILIDPSGNIPKLSNQFKAEINIFKGHYTSIKTGFTALCNIGNIKVSATFNLIDIDVARSNDCLVAELKFRHPICPMLGSEFVFREGISIGHGRIISILN